MLAGGAQSANGGSSSANPATYQQNSAIEGSNDSVVQANCRISSFDKHIRFLSRVIDSSGNLNTDAARY
jgi:hypothetical protein